METLRPETIAHKKCCTITVLNISIIQAFHAHQSNYLRNRGIHSVSATSIPIFANIRRERIKREFQLTRMLLRVTFAFLFLTFPIQIRYAVYSFIDKYESPSSYALFIFLNHFSNKCFYTLSGINFYLYCMSGHKFRTDLKTLCCRKCNSVKNQNPSTSKSQEGVPSVSMSTPLW